MEKAYATYYIVPAVCLVLYFPHYIHKITSLQSGSLPAYVPDIIVKNLQGEHNFELMEQDGSC